VSTRGALDPALRRVRTRFLAEADDAPVDPVRHLELLLEEEAPLLARASRAAVARQLSVELTGLGPIQRLLDDPLVDDVLVNGVGPVWVDRGGRLELSEVCLDATDVARCIERLLGPLGLRADRSHPVVDARTPEGTRVSIVLPPLAVDGPVLAIRRHRTRPVPLAAFGPPQVERLLRHLVTARVNLVVYGATGSGKTTLLDSMLGHLEPGERVVTIEDVAELRLPGEHVVRLESRPGGAEGVQRSELRDLVRVALRLRPDRIVVGEVRGAEALDMVWALSTGHDGCCSTCHASDARDALRRLETMAAVGGAGVVPMDAIRAQLHAAVDVLIGVARGHDGARSVVAVDELDPAGALSPLLDADGTTRAPRRDRRPRR
jgi:pilus assembly protein CpaF